MQLSRVEGRGSTSFYFHQNAFTKAGDKMVFSHANPGSGESLYSLDAANSAVLGSGKATRVADSKKMPGFRVVGLISRDVFYFSERSILATNLDTLKTRVIASLPSDWDMSAESITGLTLNSNETLLAGANTIGADASFNALGNAPRGKKIDATFNAHLPTFLFTVDVKSGKITVILRGHDWFNHVQFSPKDPSLLMFAHEGPWAKVDRIWLIRADGSGLVNFRPRKIPGEAVGHEFWDPSGKVIWFDYSVGKSRSLVGKNISRGQEMGYSIRPEQMSVHYNISHDGKFFAGDGGTYNHNTNPMIQLFVPQPDGSLRSEHLCGMAKNDYSRREPNVMFSPDDRWVIFSSTQSGKSEVYAVSIAKW
jgi:oligogalacturonide lyase